MFNGILKKVLFVLIVVVVFQNWGKIQRILNPSGVISEQTRADARVVLYATQWCGYCKATRRFLDEKGIPFKEFDIDKDATAREAYEALGGRGIPILDVNGTLIRDFKPEAIEAALKPPAKAPSP